MEKPIKPIMPDASDRVKYPRPLKKEGVNFLQQPIYLPNTDYIRDYRKFQKDTIQYEGDIVLYWQIKYIEDIKRSNLKLCLKKYTVTKNK